MGLMSDTTYEVLQRLADDKSRRRFMDGGAGDVPRRSEGRAVMSEMRGPEINRVLNWINGDPERAAIWASYANGYLAGVERDAEPGVPAAAAEFMLWMGERSAGL